MKGYIGNRNWSFKKIYRSGVNKDVVSLPNCSTCCQRMRKERAAGTCVLSCTLHFYNLICLRRWLRNSITQSILSGPCQHRAQISSASCLSQKNKNTSHKYDPSLTPGVPQFKLCSGSLSHVDELIYLPAVNRSAETLAPVEEDKEFDRKESPVRLLDRSRLSKFSSTLNESF